MFEDSLAWSGFLQLCFWILGGFVLGKTFEIIVPRWFRQWAQRSRWSGDDIIIEELQRIGVPFFALGAVYFGVPAVGFATTLEDWLQIIVLVAVVGWLIWVVMDIATRFTKMYAEQWIGGASGVSLLINTVRLVVFVVGGLMILQTVGVSITPVLTALGVGGLAVALALQPTLTNYFSGLQLLASKMLEPGDYVKLDAEHEGIVQDITWRNTTIKTLSNNFIVVPNSKVAESVLINYNYPDQTLSIKVEVGVDYKSDLEKVEQLAIEVGKMVIRDFPGAIAEVDPVIRFHAFQDSSIGMKMFVRARTYADQFALQHELVKKIHRAFAEAGIGVPYPQREIHVRRDGGSF